MKVTLKLPETLPSQAFDLSIYVASKLYGDGLLSAGQASQMTGLSKRAFIEIMGKYGVSAFSESLDDLTIRPQQCVRSPSSATTYTPSNFLSAKARGSI